MKKLLLLFIVISVSYYLYNNNNEKPARYGEVHNEVIMYSLTTCGFCKQKAKELREEQIAFREYFIDKDRERWAEVTEKLSKAGFKPRSYGTPIMDVHGVMLPNNPAMSLIKSHMQDSGL